MTGATIGSYLGLPVLPPHEPDDLRAVARMVDSLEDGHELQPVVVFRMGDHYQAVTGSHRLVAWAQFEALFDVDRRRLILLTDEEVAEALSCMPWLPQTIAQAWPLLSRVGEFASQLHWTASRPEVRAALQGQW